MLYRYGEGRGRIPTERLLIGCPVCQEPEVLKLFLRSLRRLELPGVQAAYHFVDDNHDPRSKALLEAFQAEVPNITVRRPQRQEAEMQYRGHNWNEHIIWKVAQYKNHMIERALREGFTHLFLVDSDVLLHPKAVRHLMDTGKEIVSQVFWTRWQEDAVEQPQVWIRDFYTQFDQKPGEQLTQAEERARTYAFFAMLRVPGLYEVGGLGACTMIRRSALEQGVSFRPVRNLSFWGEDRHFCVRAAARDIPLFADTVYPAFHVFRPGQLEGGRDFLQRTEPN